MAESTGTTRNSKAGKAKGSKTKSKASSVTSEPITAFSTALSLSSATRSKLIASLQQHMADNDDLYSQTKFAHWNVKGDGFFYLHKLFDELAGMIQPFTDELAERITLLGGIARGTSRQTAATSSLEEFPDGPQDGTSYLQALQARFAEHADNSRKHAEAASELDATTEDLFIEISRTVDQALYFIEAHLQK